ncbi:MAG: NADH-quinone oxidoreductase subunit L, partial [Mycobacterium sp.]
AGITAFYMTRVMLMTFHGERRWASDQSEVTPELALQHPHEAPRVMIWPMIALAVGAVFSGGLLAIGGTLQHWLEPVVSPAGSPEVAHAIPAWASGTVTLVVVLAGAFVAYRMYATKPIPVIAPTDVSALTVAARSDLYGDAFNEGVFMRPGDHLAHALVEVDDRVVDGSVNTLAALVGRASDRVRGLQTGFVRSYALTMCAGAVLVVAVILAAQL